MARCSHPNCGATMLHYENPPRDICPRAHEHSTQIGKAHSKGPHKKDGNGRRKGKKNG
jgi:hypothetical protein